VVPQFLSFAYEFLKADIKLNISGCDFLDGDCA
jgi:hypothetical protein